MAIDRTYNEVSAAHRWLLGESYRPLGAAPVKLRAFHLAQEKGGLTVI